MPRGYPKAAKQGQPARKATTPNAPAALQQPAQPEQPAAHRGPVRSQDIDSMAGAELRAYARRIGVSGRDCDSLAEDRLRQNCKLFLNAHFQALTE